MKTQGNQTKTKCRSSVASPHEENTIESPSFGRNHMQYILEGEIDTRAIRAFLSFASGKLSDNCTTLDVLIQSGGGSVPVALAFAELLMSLPCKIRTYNLSNVDSASVIIFASGKERFAPKGTTFYFHPVGKEICGVKSASELRSLADEIDYDTFRATEFIAQRTGTDSRRWMDMMTEETIINHSVALKLGLATSCERPEIWPSKLVVLQ